MKKTTKKKVTRKINKKEVKKKGLGRMKTPSKFILHISKCGTDALSYSYKQVEHDNPVILGLKGIDVICDGFAPKDKHPFFKYLLACGLLNGLTFDRKKLFDDVDNVADRIKGLSLKELKGGNEDGRS